MLLKPLSPLSLVPYALLPKGQKDGRDTLLEEVGKPGGA